VPRFLLRSSSSSPPARAAALFATALAGLVALGACGDDDTVVPRTGTCTPPLRGNDREVSLASALGGQKFTGPIEIALGPNNRLYVLEQKGIVRVVDVATGAPATTAIDISSKITAGGEAGLLGIAFDPKFADNRFVYLHFTAPTPTKIDGVVFQSVIARFESKDGGATIDATTEKRLLVVDQPYANHNGGKIAFGPDGMLYVALGDGGSGGDPRGNGQNKETLLGKILRIDPKGGDPYGIPPTNPFAAGGGRPEIYAYGLRNPWKFSFDTVTGELWAADVGQSRFEEVDRIVLGGNYGWNTREGKHCYEATTCPTEGLIDPVVEYGRSEGVSITGGYVYRGKKLPALYGKYVFGDFGTGRIWAVDKDASGAFVSKLLVETDSKISTFAQDADGEIYVADYARGTVQALLPAGEATVADGLGALLSTTGCLDPKEPATPPPGLVAYSINSELWSDGADKERWLYVPQGKKIGVGADGDLDLPTGSVVVKSFGFGGKRVETRLLVRYDDGAWAGYSYEWNDEQTEATLLTSGKSKALPNGGSWYFPSRGECLACHTAIAGYSLGLEVRQLDRDEGGQNQLARLADLFDRPVTPGALAPLVSAGTPGATDEARARGYLHANCSFCHREGSGTGAATFDVRVEKSFAETRTCNAPPQGGDLGIAGARLIAPGDPLRSALALRIRALDTSRMPPLASRVVDEQGARAVEAWIRGLPAACP